MARDEEKALYMIGVAARIAGMHPQTLRIYERKKLIRPQRSVGSTRLYSEADIKKLKLIKKLTQTYRVNLAGVKLIIDLRSDIEDLEGEIEETEKRFLEVREKLEEEIEKVKKSYRRDLVLFPRGKLVKR